MATALSTGLHYLLSLGTQEAIEALAAELARSGLGARWADVVTRQRALTVLTDVAAIPAGLAIQAQVPSHPGEATLRGALRQSGWWRVTQRVRGEGRRGLRRAGQGGLDFDRRTVLVERQLINVAGRTPFFAPPRSQASVRNLPSPTPFPMPSAPI